MFYLFLFLSPFLFLILLFLVVVFSFHVPFSSYKQDLNYKDIYVFKKNLITENELNFYNVLMDICKEYNFVLFCQVSLYQIISVKSKFSRYSYYRFFNKISSKCIDFVLCDKNNCNIKICIELDDSSHNREDRVKRDNFINTLFNDLNIPLIRYKASFNYDYDDIKNLINSKISFDQTT